MLKQLAYLSLFFSLTLLMLPAEVLGANPCGTTAPRTNPTVVGKACTGGTWSGQSYSCTCTMKSSLDMSTCGSCAVDADFATCGVYCSGDTPSNGTNPCGDPPSTPTGLPTGMVSDGWDGSTFKVTCDNTETFQMANAPSCKIYINQDCGSYLATDMAATVGSLSTASNGSWSYSPESVTIKNGLDVVIIYTVSGLPSGWTLADPPVAAIGTPVITDDMDVERFSDNVIHIYDYDSTANTTDKRYNFSIQVTDGTTTHSSDPTIVNKGSQGGT